MNTFFEIEFNVCSFKSKQFESTLKKKAKVKQHLKCSTLHEDTKFAEDNCAGGHYHYELNADVVDYEAYFRPVQQILRVDRPN